MFILNLTYQKSLAEVTAALPDHYEYLEKYYQSGNFLASGRKEPRTGGIILSKFTSLEQVEAAIQDDPFLQRGIATYDITEFLPSKMSTSFESVMD